jgi:hypothetical protein
MSVTAKNLSRQQEKVLDTLLIYGQVEKAASAAGVSARTIFRYLQQEAFQEALRKSRSENFKATAARLQAIASTATETLEQVMLDKEAAPSARVSAARAALELAGRYAEVEDLDARLSEIEKTFNKGGAVYESGKTYQRA